MSTTNMTTITSLPVPASSLPAALPTPPFSPPGSVFHHHTSQMLDALVAQYQRERMWVKQTLDVIALARHQHLHGSPLNHTSAPGTGSPVPLWQRRRSQHSLRLSNLSHAKLSKRLLMHNACGTRVLDSFAALLDARIESCKRIELLLSQSPQHRRHPQ
ncbi:hypothetical protein JB92DRAFT_2904711 [Gautieria morchelliformis]|nr:hypothetical protein JB92DRAFT_2904711 [Gautieria morchelliformis]